MDDKIKKFRLKHPDGTISAAPELYNIVSNDIQNNGTSFLSAREIRDLDYMTDSFFADATQLINTLSTKFNETAQAELPDLTFAYMAEKVRSCAFIGNKIFQVKLAMNDCSKACTDNYEDVKKQLKSLEAQAHALRRLDT